MQNLGIGIIGCGNISEAYLELAGLFKGMEVRAVADVNAAAAEARAQEFDVDAESVAELLARADIDVVVNLTVPAAHFEISKQALEAGKHVYSEKPFVLTLEEGQALEKIAKAGNLRIGSAPDTFLGGAHQAARAAIDEGDIGRVIGGTCHVFSHGMEDWHPNPDFFFMPGAGPIFDLGPYYLTNLVQLIGSIKKVTAIAKASFETRTIGNGEREGETIPVKTPTNIHAVMEFENGAIVTLGASWDVWAHRHKEMELYGESASLYVPDPNFFGGEVELATPEDVKPVEIDHPFGVPNFTDGRGNQRANYRGAGLADMIVAIQENRPHRCSFELAQHVVETMGAILKSAETGVALSLQTSCVRPDPIGSDEAKALMK